MTTKELESKLNELNDKMKFSVKEYDKDQAKEVYFIRNNTSDFMAFSDVIKMPHNEEVKEFYHINEWVKEFK